MLTRIARISFHNRLVGKHLKTCLKLSLMNSFTNVNKTFYRRMMSNLPTETDGNTGNYGGPLGTRLFRRKSHSFCVLEVVFLNNRAFLYKCAAFP